MNTKKLISLLVATLSFIILNAQNENFYRSKENKLYWQNKKPHAAYWQQDVLYKIDANVDEKTRVIDAKLQLTYWNNSPDTLQEVYFHLYQNAFVKGSYLEELHKANHQKIKTMGTYQQKGLGTLVENLRVNGKKVKFMLDNTIMKVSLPEKLMPGSSINFEMDFATFFDRGDFRRRMAVYPSYGFPHFNGVHWYPRIAVYDMRKGWDTDQHLNKELYGDYGTFDVKLTFANNYIVEATGVLQNTNEVLPEPLRKKLDIKNFANKPWNEKPSTIIPYDSSKRKTWHYIAHNVHDFAFTADPAYRIGEAQWNGVQCIALVLEPHASKWQTTAEYVAKIIKTYSEDFGMYAYPKMVAADANDGMEYPMLTLDGGADPDNRGLLAHEIGHNWFYGMVGNNETYRAALDEGFTQFLTAWALIKIDGKDLVETKDKNSYKRKFREAKNVRDRTVYTRYLQDAIRKIDKPLNTHSNDFHSAIGHENGYGNVYYKTATMLYNLQYTLGDTLFQNAMKHYVSKWQIAHPYFDDFRTSVKEIAKTDMDWYFDQWLETTKTIDYGIKSIRKGLKKDEYKIKFVRYGEMQMPIDFTVTDKNNNQQSYYIPNTYFVKKTENKLLNRWYGWDLLYPSYTAKVNIPGGIKMVQIDTSYRLADIDMMDNYKRPGLKLCPETQQLKFENYIYNPMSWKQYQGYIRPDIWWNAVDGIKAGIHYDGSYMGYLRKLYVTVWLNTRIGALEQYRPLESAGWWQDHSPINYTARYETPFKKISNKIHWGLDSRFLDGLARHNIYSYYQLNDNNTLRFDATTMYRNTAKSYDYLIFPNEWSPAAAPAISQTKNTFVQLQYKNTGARYAHRWVNTITARTGLNYDYSFIQTENILHTSWKKLEIHARFFGRYGMGKKIPTESALYMQGANPEEMMENKFTRSQGIVPLNWGGFHTDNFSIIHAGGGLNLRGYNGYYTADDRGGIVAFNYKGISGASINTEIDFDRYINFKPKYIRDYIHFDTYLFADAGVIDRTEIDFNNLNQVVPLNEMSKLRACAGLGFAMTLKKLGPFEKFSPFTLRMDFPLFLSSPPHATPDFFAYRYIIGIGRSF